MKRPGIWKKISAVTRPTITYTRTNRADLGGGIITEKKYKMQFTNADGTVEHIEFHSDIRTRKFEPLSSLGSNKVPNSIVSTSKDLQQTL